MKKQFLLVLVPLAAAIPFLMSPHDDRQPPIQPREQRVTEQAVGFHLLVPTSLPRGMQPDENGIRRGALRVIADYSNGEDILIVAQEKRTPERDLYDRRRFAGSSFEIDGNPATFTKGSFGERRLAVFTPNATVVLSSTSLTPLELTSIARSLR
jgi:hypothetical protein